MIEVVTKSVKKAGEQSSVGRISNPPHVNAWEYPLGGLTVQACPLRVEIRP